VEKEKQITNNTDHMNNHLNSQRGDEVGIKLNEMVENTRRCVNPHFPFHCGSFSDFNNDVGGRSSSESRITVNF
jgi:hypothetical protein